MKKTSDINFFGPLQRYFFSNDTRIKRATRRFDTRLRVSITPHVKTMKYSLGTILPRAINGLRYRKYASFVQKLDCNRERNCRGSTLFLIYRKKVIGTRPKVIQVGGH